MTKVHTTQMVNGDFVIVDWRDPDGDFLNACCGCGLVHKWHVTVINEHQVMLQIFREEELTKQERANRRKRKK
jgi:hypothetical protein